jgi:LacI family transcriptional regulator
MNEKRATIYDLARAMDVSPSYVSKALNNHPSINQKVREEVRRWAKQLNYKHNSRAANLRKGTSRTLGVIVPKINQTFFSDVIAGIERTCFENNHSLIICQSHESYELECRALETFLHQQVDCILISVSSKTRSHKLLQEVIDNNIPLIQFDRCLDSIESHKVENDNVAASYKAAKHLLQEGYQRIAFIGGPEHLPVFRQRKEGFLKAIKETQTNIPYNFVTTNELSEDAAKQVARELLQLKEPPDAFFTVADLLSLGVLQTANEMNLLIPQQIGIIGFANELITRLLKPSLSSINQKATELGACAAGLYFDSILTREKAETTFESRIIESEIIIRDSSRKKCSPL